MAPSHALAAGLFAAVILTGAFQLVFGALKFGKFVHLIPLPVTFGFVNGLALVIGLAQVEQFKTAGGGYITGAPLYSMLAIVAGVMATMYFLP